MTTALDIISITLREAGVLGVGQTAGAEDFNDCLRTLNGMLAQWQRKRWLVPFLTDVSAVGNNLISNPVGAGQTFNTPRPDKINAAYVRLSNQSPTNPVDYPLEQIFSYEDYSKVALKSLNSFPSYFFYDAHYPYGNLFIWPIPSNIYTVHILVKGAMQTFATAQTAFAFPPEYEEAIRYNLAVRLRPLYQLPPDMTIIALAKAALNTIRMANVQVPTLSLGNSGGSDRYNVFSDQGN